MKLYCYFDINSIEYLESYFVILYVALCEKMSRATIPLHDRKILLVTIDNAGGQKQILDQVLNEVIYHDPTNPGE